jgi:hypothetical protein
LACRGYKAIAIDPKASPAKTVYDKIEELSPQSDAQRSLRSQALTMALDVGRTRVLLFEHLGTSIPVPFLVVLVFWLCIIFASFGLFAPRKATVITVLGVCALSVSGAIFLILEPTGLSRDCSRSPAPHCAQPWLSSASRLGG